MDFWLIKYHTHDIIEFGRYYFVFYPSENVPVLKCDEYDKIVRTHDLKDDRLKLFG